MCVYDPFDEDTCDCPGHTMPGVYHVVACCSRPHVEDTDTDE